ncbi:MAG: ADP-ribosylglycohydrolase family protein [Gemmataceae bacterium]|jgi:ADP-ribosylglycohydrolase|nr:ADP-ribosylglycohydrolase family protein [Gemmataceae bacterium]
MEIEIDSITGSLMGCAAGDALGLPYEGLSRRRALRLLGEPTRYRFLFHRGMISDDTEHTCLVAQSLCRYPNDLAGFTRSLRWGLRWWFASLPPGIGKATAQACIKLWFGFRRTGVYSAGNGPAMRAGILGASIDSLDQLKAWITASTQITHTDPKALEGALAIGLAAWCAKRKYHTPEEFFPRLRSFLGSCTPDCEKWLSLLETVCQQGTSFEEFLGQIRCQKGISGYMFHTVPAVLFLWLKSPHDWQGVVQTLIRAGGDTDSTAAIAGSVIGSGVGPEGIPELYRNQLQDWPRSVRWMMRLAEALKKSRCSGLAESPPFYFSALLPIRNLFFLLVVMAHLIRRLFPPY